MIATITTHNIKSKVAPIQIKLSWPLQLCSKLKQTDRTFDSFFSRRNRDTGRTKTGLILEEKTD
jgi:hypothetical protein